MITMEKVSALSIFMHRLLQTHDELVKSGWKEYVPNKEQIGSKSEEEARALHNKHIAFINKEFEEQRKTFALQGATLDSLDPSLKNISHNRMFYYYSIALKQLESFSKENKEVEVGILVISCLINLTSERSITKNKECEPILDNLIKSYRIIGVSREIINKTIDLADKIIEVVSEANYALMMKKNIKKRRKKR